MENLSELQIINSRDFSGLTEYNHLVSAYLAEPEMMEGVLAYAFGIQNNNILSLITGGIGNTKYISDRQYKWDLHGQTELVVKIGQATTDGGTTPGIGGSRFRIFLEENSFEATDVLRMDDTTHVRVMEEPVQLGTVWQYWVQLTNSDPEAFLNPSNLAVGSAASKMYSTVEEFSMKGGGTNYNTPTKLINQLTTLRKHFGVSRNAAKTVIRMEYPNPLNPSEKTTLWTRAAEWTALAQWMREKERSKIYTTFNSAPVASYTNLKGQSGRPVYEGAGLRQQISPSNRRFYSSLTYAQLDDFFLDLSYSAEPFGGNSKFLVITGKMGTREFHNAIQAEQNLKGITVTDSGVFISGTGQKLTLQGQFTGVKLLNGIEVTVKEFPVYDDRTHNRLLHPVSKRPQESYRLTAFSTGMIDNHNNLRNVALKDSENVMWHVSGSTDPRGAVGKSMDMMRSSSMDGYRVEFLDEGGIQLQDPTSAGELILNLA